MPISILDQLTKSTPFFLTEHAKKLQGHLYHLEIVKSIEDKVFQEKFGKGAYETRALYRLAPECLRDNIREANMLASEKIHELYSNNLVQDYIIQQVGGNKRWKKQLYLHQNQ